MYWRLILFALWFTPPLAANELCRIILARVGSADFKAYVASKPKKDADYYLVNEIIELIRGQSGNPEGKKIPYKKLVITNNSPERTLHSYRLGGEGHTDPVELNADDSRLVLTLPTDPSQTVWKHLTAPQRERLVNSLASMFKAGTYDLELLEPEKGEEKILKILDKAQSDALKKSDDNFLEAGLSPAKFLDAAVKGCKVGVCRNSNVALAGLLGELGLPADQVKIVTATKPDSDQYHLWMEYRATPTGPWIEVDATPVGGGISRLVGEMYGTAQDNRKKYPDDQKEWLYLLKPLTFKPFPADGFDPELIERLLRGLRP